MKRAKREVESWRWYSTGIKRVLKKRESGPDFERGVPRAGGDGGAVRTELQAADAVLMRVEHLQARGAQRVPEVHHEVAAAREQQAPREREVERAHREHHRLLAVHAEFAVRAQVEQPALEQRNDRRVIT